MTDARYLTEEQTRRLKSLMVGAGYGVESMALAMNMSRPTFSARLNGRQDFTKSEMELFASLVSEKPQAIFFAA